MLSILRNRFGIPGLISVMALVFALFGGAYAASSEDSSDTASASKSKRQSKQGKRGKRGKPGKPGPTGPQGATGPQGPAGANGTNGSDGATGPAGATGPIGPTGPTGTFDSEPLPSNETLTGVWSVAGNAIDVGLASISFPIEVSPPPTIYWENATAGFSVTVPAETAASSLPEPIAEVIITQEEFEEECPGTAASPQAPPGALCVYLGPNVGVTTDPGTVINNLIGPSPFGTSIPVKFEGGEPGFIRGTWAVTAE